MCVHNKLIAIVLIFIALEHWLWSSHQKVPINDAHRCKIKMFQLIRDYFPNFTLFQEKMIFMVNSQITIKFEWIMKFFLEIQINPFNVNKNKSDGVAEDSLSAFYTVVFILEFRNTTNKRAIKRRSIKRIHFYWSNDLLRVGVASSLVAVPQVVADRNTLA